MTIQVLVHPYQIVLEYALNSSIQMRGTCVYDIISDRLDLTEDLCTKLSILFNTSKEYWMNMQKQYDDMIAMTGEADSCPDMAIPCCTYEVADRTVNRTSQPAKVGDKVLMTEQSYKYMLSKCTRDELFDLGWLGNSEEHVVVTSQNVLRGLLSTNAKE
jgi:plasmid maintenance system antidote protein VapI